MITFHWFQAVLIAGLAFHAVTAQAEEKAPAAQAAKAVSADALLQAASAGKLDEVKKLIAAGADVNAKTSFGDTALILAAFRNRGVDMVKALIDAKADVNAKNKADETALMWAASEADLATVNALIAAKADVNAKDKKGETALMKASKVEIVKALIAAKADVNAKDKKGETALMKEKELEVVQALLAAKADIKVKNKDGKTALKLAAIRVSGREDEIVTALLAAGGSEKDVFVPDSEDDLFSYETFWMSRDENPCGIDLEEMKGYLDGSDLNLDAADPDKGMTMLMWAAMKGCADHVRALTKSRVNVNAKDLQGKTALDYAKTDEIRALLKAVGAK